MNKYKVHYVAKRKIFGVSGTVKVASNYKYIYAPTRELARAKFELENKREVLKIELV